MHPFESSVNATHLITLGLIVLNLFSHYFGCLTVQIVQDFTALLVTLAAEERNLLIRAVTHLVRVWRCAHKSTRDHAAQEEHRALDV